MARLEQDDHTIILDSRFRYARVDNISLANDTLDITLLDGDLNPTSETWQDVSIFFHCDPERQLLPNGSLQGAAKAFRIGDTAVIRFEAGAPIALGVKGKLRRCSIPSVALLHVPTGKIHLGTMTGRPERGDVKFSDFWEWGEALTVYFGPPTAQLQYCPFAVPDRYWALDADGKVRYAQGEAVAMLKRGQAAEEKECTGLPADITDICVTPYDWSWIMLLSRISGNDEIVERYSSTNCRDWSFQQIVFGSAHGTGRTEMVHNFLAVAGEGLGIWHKWDELGHRELYHMEFLTHCPEARPAGYPADFARIWRVGHYKMSDEYGNLRSQKEAWSATADMSPQIQYTFQFENYFQVDGLELDEVQLIQLWGEYWLNE